jgi:hypothetical protein
MVLIVEELVPDPVQDEAVRGEQAQAPVLLDGLQGPNPGVELLLRELSPQMVDATLPDRAHREESPRP